MHSPALNLRRRAGMLLAALALAAVSALPAFAARLHVAPGGLLTSGPSTPGDWTAAGCYPTLAAAAAAAAPADTILLDRTDHAVPTAASLPAALLNRSLDADTTGCRLVFGAAGTLTVKSGAGAFLVRGLVLQGDGVDSDVPALRLDGGRAASADLQDLAFLGLKGSDVSGRGGACLTLAGDGLGIEVRIARCTFADNATRGYGGALWAGDGWNLVIEDCDFTDNASYARTPTGNGRGGALMVNSPVSPTRVQVRRTSFLRSIAQGPGGAISIDDGGLDMEDVELAESVSAWGLTTTWSAGAGVFLRRNLTHPDTLRLDLRRCVIRDNVGLIDLDPWSGDGGGVMVKGHTDRYYVVHAEDCTFSGNYAAQGGGFYIGRYTNGDVVRCRFIANTAYLQGGGAFKGGALVFNRGETATFLHCEFIGNRAGLDHQGNDSLELGNGGAFSTRARPRGVFYNCSFRDNSVHGVSRHGAAVHKPSEGDYLSIDAMRNALVNCAFWSDDPTPQVYGDLLGYSQVTNCAMRPGDFVCSGVTPTGTVDLAAAPYAGPLDLRPAAGSPLVDAGVPQAPTLDLAGNPAPLGGVMDIGAYESLDGVSAVPAVTVAALAAHPNPFNPAVTLSFSLARDVQASLTVYDVAGRAVAVLLAPVRLAAGEHTLVWRGCDDHGRTVGSGTYLAVLRTPDGPAAAKLTLVR
ncbi:MAG TPA: choice-of-anchor Q domain-containing protein [Candidatus Krumholzibacteria bacterium]|nr:choice-of-anchor Q domain-containing protein [Candidatus Krumholzibacteria bacterium]